ncbi:patatin-like phospholipase family protein [Stieleria varia]|nr:cyclic nucleotide-binding and patatin-like phospholipase domain-containing protein [Stieleria varia]
MDESVTRSLLMGLAGEGLEEVLSSFAPRSFEAGDTIVAVGEVGDELFLITAGKVRVWSGEGPAVSERTLSILGPGDHFGEAAALGGGRRTATVTAVSYVETLVLSGPQYRRLLKQYPQLLENVSRSLTRRLTQMNAASRSPDKSKRKVHSLAIIVDHPAGWSLAQSMLGTLRKNDQVIQPILVTDTPPPVSAREMDPDMLEVNESDLAITIAGRSRGDCFAVAIAHGPVASAAATKQCDRVIVAMDAQKGLASFGGEIIRGIPAHRRPIAAMLYPADINSRPKMDDDSVHMVRCKITDVPGGQMHQAHIAAESIVRLRRSLNGVRVGLALGGGGARGIAHVGVLEVLQRENIVFDSIAGTSAGSIVAAAISSGYAADEVGQFFRDEMIPPKFFAKSGALRRAWLVHSFRGSRFETKLRRYMKTLDFAQVDLPLSITTLDLISGNQMIRRSGDVVNAVLQSINHPVFGRPILAEGQMLVDGGVLMNVPASVLRAEGCDYVISVDVGSTLSTDYARDKNGNPRRPSYISTLLRTMDISRRHSSALHSEESDLIITPETQAFKIEDFHAVDPLIDAGREVGERMKADVKRLIDNLRTDLLGQNTNA